MRRFAFAVVAGVLAVAGCTASPPGAAPSVVGAQPSASASVVPGYHPGAATMGDPLFPASGNGGYDVSHYAITISYLPSSKTLTGEDVVTATATQSLSRFDLDLHGLTVRSVTVNGAAAAYGRSADKLVITPAHGIDYRAAFTTDILYTGQPDGYQDAELGVEGFLPSGEGALAQGEPDVAASWFPVNDHPRDKATYDITVTAPSTLAALANGVLVDKVAAGDRTTWHWRESAPMASYLATVVIGDYRVVDSTHNGLPVVLAVASKLPTSVDATLARTPEVLDFLVTQFGPYPFASTGGIVHDDTRLHFALENQSRPVYAPGFFQTGADASWVIAHELAHQWYGDSLSVQNWRDLWLNEGFATYAEWLWTEHTGGESARQSFQDMYQAIRSKKIGAAAPGAPTQRNLFGDAVYKRGAATLGALRVTVGDGVFFKIIRSWAAEHAGQNVSTEEFIAYVDQVTGRRLDDFFHSWLYESSPPPEPTPAS
jgi:aminopeptidase N